MFDLNELLEDLREAQVSPGAKAGIRRERGMQRFGRKTGFKDAGGKAPGKVSSGAKSTVRREKGMQKFGKRRGFEAPQKKLKPGQKMVFGKVVSAEAIDFDDLMGDLREREED
jgi:hypothetical protein